MMNAQPSSLRFWLWGFIFIFLLHAFGIFFFAERKEGESLWQKPSPFFYFAGSPDVDARIAELTSLRDPTLFALPHPHGFSGSAWLNFHPQIPTLTNGAESPEWLTLPPDQLDAALNDYLATNRPSDDQLLAALRAAKNPEVRIPDEPVFTNTMIAVEGALTSRRLISRPPLPSATNAEVLRPTVVRVSVNGDGAVETSSVTIESGSKSADSLAVELSRRLSFQPLPIPDARARQFAPPTAGRIVFTWHVVTGGTAARAGAR